MNRKRLLVVVGLLGVVAAATGCQDSKARKDIRDIDGYLTANYAWLDRVDDAICQIEERTAGLDPAKRICPTGPGDISSPPKYPPN